MSNRAIIFLISSFLSAVGDSVLVFAVPVGMGLETHDLRAAVLMWLIPAVAMFLSSFLTGQMEKRHQSARSDYGKLLLGIAALELGISILALMLRTPVHTVVLIAAFVFFYALAKEGIPRLLYLVSVYRYFVDSDEYTKMVGTSSGLNIAATLVGTCLAGVLVAAGSWRIALVFDAATFVIFGITILKFGTDPKPEPEQKVSGFPTVALQPPSDSASRALRGIQVLVPLLFGVNALIWNYLPLLNERYAVLSSASSIFVIGFLRVPGMISGFFVQKIFGKISKTKMIFVLPLIFLMGSVAFSAAPSIALFGLLVILQGLLSGIYWPADYGVRNTLTRSHLIRFNTRVLRKLALTQFSGCLLALWIFSPLGPGLSAISTAAMGLIAVSVLFHWVFERRSGGAGPKAILPAALCLITVFLASCSRHEKEAPHNVILPSVSENLDLRPDLTYAASAIINDTSAHLVRISGDLTIQGEVLSRFESQEAGKRYLMELKPEYRSARGETITADDVKFSIQYYLAKKQNISGALSAIQGAESCHREDCALPGVRVDGEGRITVTLRESDIKWVEKLASPWLVLLKKNKPTTEKIGTCTVPYQTGRALVVACAPHRVEMMIAGRSVVVSDDPATKPGAASLLTESPTEEASPSLTVLTAFANPASKRLTERDRARFFSLLRANGKAIAAKLHLKFAALLTPEWLGVDVPLDLSVIHPKEGVSCPSGAPIKILLDTSLPRLPVLKDGLQEAIGCPVEFSVTNADTYFKEFAKADIGIAWFTPDFLDLYDIFAPFDCAQGNACPFNWHDASLQRHIDKIRGSGFLGAADKTTAIEIERILLKRGYVAPLAEMNWWIKKIDGSVTSIHPAGLFQVRVSDFL